MAKTWAKTWQNMGENMACGETKWTQVASQCQRRQPPLGSWQSTKSLSGDNELVAAWFATAVTGFSEPSIPSGSTPSIFPFQFTSQLFFSMDIFIKLKTARQLSFWVFGHIFFAGNASYRCVRFFFSFSYWLRSTRHPFSPVSPTCHNPCDRLPEFCWRHRWKWKATLIRKIKIQWGYMCFIEIDRLARQIFESSNHLMMVHAD